MTPLRFFPPEHKMRCSIKACGAILALNLCVFVSLGADWPTLHKDYQRSGYTDEIVRGPNERKWFRSFVEEMIGPRVEAIVADGLCFVGTYAGNFYALDVESGKTAWSFNAGGAIGHSPCYRDGKIYFCTDDGFNSGTLFCLSAKDGKELWRYRAAAGIWNSPACDGQQVYVGDRGGVFHAVDANTGQKSWTFASGVMILKPASFSPDGKKIVFGCEDMHVYCLSPDGELLWKSAKLAGLSLRDAAPTIWADKVVVRTNPAKPFHEALHEGGRLVNEIQRRIPLDEREDKVIVNNENQYFLHRTDRREKAECEGVRDYLARHPHSRTWFTLNLSDGKEPWIVPVLFTVGLHNPPTPPTFKPKSGELYTHLPTALSVYCSSVSVLGAGIGRIDPQTGYVTNVAHAHGDVMPGYFAGMPMQTDETSSLSLMGDFLVCTHQGAIGGVDLKTRKLQQLCGARDSYGGLFGPGVAPGGFKGSTELVRQGYVQNLVNEWHGPDRAVAAIAAGRLFWVVGSCVICVSGPEVPAGTSGGRKPPSPWKWAKPPRIDGGNLTGALGGNDRNVKKKLLDAAAVEKYLQTPSPVQPSLAPLAVELRRRQDAAVAELVEGHPWAPLVVELGISHEEQHFWRSSETMQAVAMSLPHLSPRVRSKAIAYLDKLFEAGVPLDRPVLGEGRRREHYQLAPELLAGPAGRPPQYTAALGDLYALWAYAHYADRWEKVAAKSATVRARFHGVIAKPFAFNPDGLNGEAVELLNGDIAGLIGYARIMRRTGDEAEAKAAVDLLARMATERVQYEVAESRLQAITGHHAKVPRYLRLTPEVGQVLSDYAGRQLATNLADLGRQLPVWYQAWGERLIGGENYISPPHLARALFLAMAEGLHATPEELQRYLDQPWCKADLYYIEKLTAVLGRADNAR